MCAFRYIAVSTMFVFSLDKYRLKRNLSSLRSFHCLAALDVGIRENLRLPHMASIYGESFQDVACMCRAWLMKVLGSTGTLSGVCMPLSIRVRVRLCVYEWEILTVCNTVCGGVVLLMPSPSTHVHTHTPHTLTHRSCCNSINTGLLLLSFCVCVCVCDCVWLCVCVCVYVT